MLPKSRRIPKALARDVFMQGQTLSSPHLFLKILRAGNGESRFAASISKKIAPTAVLRNRTRRRIYNALREMLPSFKPGFLVGFLVKKGGEKLAYKQVSEEVKAVLIEAGLI